MTAVLRAVLVMVALPLLVGAAACAFYAGALLGTVACAVAAFAAAAVTLAVATRVRR